MRVLLVSRDFVDALAVQLKIACFVVVGDEILSGRTVDCNSSTIARAVRQAGVCVKRIVVVPDDTTVIADGRSLRVKQ